jgi:hypothetical protein
MLRDGPDNLSLMLSCITRPMRLRTVTHRPMGLIGLYIHCAPLPVGYSPTPVIWRVRQRQSVFIFDQYYIIIIIILFIVYDLISNLKLTDENGHDFQCLVWVVIFESGFYYVFIILFYLVGLFEISVYPNGLSPLAPSWYRESRKLSFGPWLIQRDSHLLLYSFWYFTGSYLLLAI